MLVLTRKVGEAVVIGDITVRVVDVAPGRIRLGIVAPKEMKVLREELLDREPHKDDSCDRK